MTCYRRRGALLLVLATCVCLVGCGPGQPKTYPVSGKVVFADGAPLTTGGTIVFESIAPEGEPVFNARGVVEPDGTFRLSTFGDGDGAVAGEHRAIVRAAREWGDLEAAQKSGSSEVVAPPVIDVRFQRFETSGLQFTVEQRDNEFSVVVQPPVGSGPGR